MLRYLYEKQKTHNHINNNKGNDMEKETIKNINKSNKDFFKMIEKEMILNFSHDILSLISIELKTIKKVKSIGGLKINFIENKLEILYKNSETYNSLISYIVLNNNYHSYNLRILKDELLENKNNSISKNDLLETIKKIEIENLKNELDKELLINNTIDRKVNKIWEI